MPIATRAAYKRAASSEPDREGDQHILVRSHLSKDNRTVMWNLTPGRHTPAELVHAARSSFDHATSHCVTNVVIAPFQQPVVTRTLGYSNVSEFALLVEAAPYRGGALWVDRIFRLFDGYFFFNQLHKYTKVELAEGLSRQNMWGCTMTDPSRGPPYQLIKLDRRDMGSSALDH